jgi:hypothetical protein
MGCCSSKEEHGGPSSGPPPVQASAVTGSSNHRYDQPKALRGISSLPLAAENDSVALKTITSSRRRVKLTSTSHAEETASNLKKRERLESAPSDVPSYRRKTAVNLCLEALNILGSSLSSPPIPGLSAASLALIDVIQKVQVSPEQ